MWPSLKKSDRLERVARIQNELGTIMSIPSFCVIWCDFEKREHQQITDTTSGVRGLFYAVLASLKVCAFTFDVKDFYSNTSSLCLEFSHDQIFLTLRLSCSIRKSSPQDPLQILFKTSLSGWFNTSKLVPQSIRLLDILHIAMDLENKRSRGLTCNPVR